MFNCRANEDATLAEKILLVTFMITTISTDILQAEAILRSGGVVAIPTETVYGLAANALDAKAVTSIFEIKERPFFDPLIVHTASLERARAFVDHIPDWAEELFAMFSPGPMTIILKKRSIIPDIVTSGLETVGIRIPNHALTLSLLNNLDFPLSAPSANPFMYVSPTSSEHVNKQLGGKIPYILDGGSCNVGVESTIIAEIDGKPSILRLGGLPIEDIERVIGSISFHKNSLSKPISPGMLESHYSPRKKVILGRPAQGVGENKRIGYIGFEFPVDGIPIHHQRILSSTGALAEAARNVFGALRELDSLDIELIYAELVPELGLGRAINDRLKRAAA